MKYLAILFGLCRHQRYGMPTTVYEREPIIFEAGRQIKGERVMRGPTTVTCLDCGKRFRYDLNEMRITGEVQETPRPAVPTQAWTFPRRWWEEREVDCDA